MGRQPFLPLDGRRGRFGRAATRSNEQHATGVGLERTRGDGNAPGCSLPVIGVRLSGYCTSLLGRRLRALLPHAINTRYLSVIPPAAIHLQTFFQQGLCVEIIVSVSVLVKRQFYKVNGLSAHCVCIMNCAQLKVRRLPL